MSLISLLDTRNGTAEIDILIPANNEAHRIKRCLQSIERQGFRNVCAIVVDNGSEDTTAAVAQELLAASPIKACLLQSPVKLSLAEVLDTLMDRATARFAKFLFADDLLGPDVLLGLHKPLAQDPDLVLSYVPRRYFDQEGACAGPTTSARVRELFPSTDDATALVYIGNHIGEPTATLIRMETVRQLGLRFDPNLRQLLDMDFWVQLCLAGPIAYVPDHHVLISRERAGETEHNIRANRIVSENQALQQRYEAQLKKNLTWPVRLTSVAYMMYRRIRARALENHTPHP